MNIHQIIMNSGNKRVSSVESEAKKIRDISNQTKRILSATKYIQRYDKIPPKTPAYYKKMLNIL